MSSDQQRTDDTVLVREAKDGNPKACVEVFKRLAEGERSSELLSFPAWYFKAARDHEELIDKAQGGGAEAAGAAEKLLAAFIGGDRGPQLTDRSEEHTSELQSLRHLVCRLLLEKKKKNK